jgi:hypothetical protein
VLSRIAVRQHTSLAAFFFAVLAEFVLAIDDFRGMIRGRWSGYGGRL